MGVVTGELVVPTMALWMFGYEGIDDKDEERGRQGRGEDDEAGVKVRA